ncbi:polysaccharide biosynthesis protein [Allostella humosa]|nr:polysaccharide biosynthesis protein [Stella humosa]
MGEFAGKRVLLLGGTGSLGRVLTRRLLSGDIGLPERIVILSRDEAKQHEMRVAYAGLPRPTDEIIYANFQRMLQFRIGDIRHQDSVARALDGIDIVVNAAAMKQVPTCEYFPHEATMTNVVGPQNLMTAVAQAPRPPEAVIGVSTDKAVEPVNVMGMTKALQERLMIAAQLALPQTRVLLVRYGNVLASRGSVVPLFLQQVRAGGPLTITDPAMTRFLLSLDAAVDAIALALRHAGRGDILVPRVASAAMVDVARALIGDRPIAMVTTGIRPGEKLHEVLISAEESRRAVDHGGFHLIRPMLPELALPPSADAPGREYSSATDPMSATEVAAMLAAHGLTASAAADGELLR